MSDQPPAPPLLTPPAPPAAGGPTISPTPAPVPPHVLRQWQMFCHLGALAGLLIPFGNILGPLLVWQIKKNEMPEIESHGKSALNFQITVALAMITLCVAGFVLSFVCIGFIFFLAALGVWVGALLMTVLNAIKANNGEPVHYPCSLTLVN